MASHSLKNVNFYQKLEYELHTNMTNMQKYAPPTLLMVPQCLAAASGRGSDSDGCDASQEAFCSGTLCMEAGFLPALDEDQSDMFTPSELRLY